MAATPQEIKKYEAKGREQVDEGLPGWFGTFADMMTLLFAFFVLLAAISTIDPVKLQNMADGLGKSVGKKFLSFFPMIFENFYFFIINVFEYPNFSIVLI